MGGGRGEEDRYTDSLVIMKHRQITALGSSISWHPKFKYLYNNVDFQNHPCVYTNLTKSSGASGVV